MDEIMVLHAIDTHFFLLCGFGHISKNTNVKYKFKYKFLRLQPKPVC
jgi:hypothetical protein